LSPLDRRAKAAQACIDRFAGLEYAPGQRDDVRMAAHLLHHLGVAVPILKGRKWSSEAQGRKLLKKMGFADLHAAVDSLGFRRIGWASAVAGDLIALPSTCGVGALGVATGNGSMLAFREGYPGATVIRIEAADHAWRVIEHG
tara:strand:- start:3369 stop:3797 length:429 start_codon:yes stop_codon:yes gene_type:complete